MRRDGKEAIHLTGLRSSLRIAETIGRLLIMLPGGREHIHQIIMVRINIITIILVLLLGMAVVQQCLKVIQQKPEP